MPDGDIVPHPSTQQRYSLSWSSKQKGVKSIMEKAVIYARYSSERQTEQSIEGQLKICQEYAQRANIAIVGEYIDRAISGTHDKRPEFQKMINHAKSKEQHFSIILVYKLDRFSRDKYESVVYKKELKANGVAVVSATELISNTPEGILLESVIEGYNQFYSAELSQKIKRGNRMNVEKGLWTGGNLPYGYKVIDRKVYIDEEQAEVIRKIFNDYANGKSKKQIVKELNAKGVKTKGRKAFGTNNLQANNMSNINYIGQCLKYGEILTNIFPRIVDDQTFEKVQEMLAKTKRLTAKGKAKVEYELTGKLFCMHSGSSMYGISGTARNGEKKTYYACKSRYKYKSCSKQNENKTELETHVVSDTKVFISKPENIERASEKLAEFHAKNITLEKIKEYEKRLDNIDREIEKLIDLALQSQGATMQAKINQRSQDLEMQKADLNSELMKLKFLQALPKTKDDYKKHLQKFVDGDPNDKAYRKRIIHGLINSVWIGDGGLFVFYNTDNEKLITLDELKQALAENGIDYNALTQHKRTTQGGSNMKCLGGTNPCELEPQYLLGKGIFAIRIMLLF